MELESEVLIPPRPSFRDSTVGILTILKSVQNKSYEGTVHTRGPSRSRTHVRSGVRRAGKEGSPGGPADQEDEGLVCTRIDPEKRT